MTLRMKDNPKITLKAITKTKRLKISAALDRYLAAGKVKRL